MRRSSGSRQPEMVRRCRRCRRAGAGGRVPRGDQVAGRFALIPASVFPPGQERVTLVAVLDSSLRLYRHRGGELVKLAGYLHRRTRGLIGSLLWLVRDAANLAIIDGTEKITRKSLDVIAVDMTAKAPAAKEQARKPCGICCRGNGPTCCWPSMGPERRSGSSPRPSGTVPIRSFSPAERRRSWPRRLRRCRYQEATGVPSAYAVATGS